MRTSTTFARWVGVMLLFAVGIAVAQRPDCPVRDAPMPRTPPGGPPPFLDRIGELVEAEEGHITGLAKLVGRANAPSPSPDVLRGLVDPRSTLLSQWRFVGYVYDEPRHKVPRVFTKDGSVLIFEQWDMAADGASVVSAPKPTVKLGRLSASRGGLKSPSGCVSASLTWHDAGVNYSLSVAGPLSLSEQRELLVNVAGSIVDAAPTSRQ